MHLLGTGEVIRGLIIDIADLGGGKRSGNAIAEEGKDEVREGVRELETSS
jgi:hypothetical protein